MSAPGTTTEGSWLRRFFSEPLPGQGGKLSHVGGPGVDKPLNPAESQIEVLLGKHVPEGSKISQTAGELGKGGEGFELREDLALGLGHLPVLRGEGYLANIDSGGADRGRRPVEEEDLDVSIQRSFQGDLWGCFGAHGAMIAWASGWAHCSFR